MATLTAEDVAKEIYLHSDASGMVNESVAWIRAYAAQCVKDALERGAIRQRGLHYFDEELMLNTEIITP